MNDNLGRARGAASRGMRVKPLDNECALITRPLERGRGLSAPIYGIYTEAGPRGYCARDNDPARIFSGPSAAKRGTIMTAALMGARGVSLFSLGMVIRIGADRVDLVCSVDLILNLES